MRSRFFDNTSVLRAVALGVAAMLIVSLLLAALAASLIHHGTLPPDRLPLICGVITLVAALAGGILCGGHVQKARLPLCVGSALVYVGLIWVLRGVCFHTHGNNLWALPLFAVVGAILGALLTSVRRR